ncbi:MAG: cell envelope integrity protein CreD [Candidatus Sedimenticola sp. 20ELBAFRAG]
MTGAEMKSKLIQNNHPFIRILGIILLVLLLQIPIFQIDGLVSERRYTRDNAIAEVTRKWGGAQVLQGPQIIVPFLEEVERKDNTSWKLEQRRAYATFLPDNLNTDVKIDSEIRHRGIYGIPLYRAQIDMSGHFDTEKMMQAAGTRKLLWDQAQFVLVVSDPKSVSGESTLILGDEPRTLEAGAGEGLAGRNGFHVPLSMKTDSVGGKFPYKLNFELGGSDGFYVAPVGRRSSIRMESDWVDPSFQGNWLPTQRVMNNEGFSASWEIPYLGRSYPQSWFKGNSEQQRKIDTSGVGVRLALPLDTYGKTERSIKYELIFIGLTFIGFWLFEILSGVRIHPLQYLLVGSAVCMFYLLLLSLSEHVGFLAAYFTAASMVVGLVTAYARNVLRKTGRALFVGSGMAALYLYLFALLQEQEYSLLAGSIGLFVILGAVMLLTRKVNWYDSSRPDASCAGDK